MATPRPKHWHFMDYVIVRTRDRKDVCITRALTGADDCWTDHQLIRSIMSVKLAPKRRLQQKQCRRKINVEGLKDPIKRNLFRQCLKEDLMNSQQLRKTVDGAWSTLKSSIISTCEKTLGFSTRKHQDWFDENDREIEELIDRKRKTFCAWQNDTNSKQKKLAHQQAKAEAQRRTRDM